MILFLDFDGVLHPYGVEKSKHFSRLPLLESLLREFPSVQVVLSTTWRELYPLNENKARFSLDLKDRIVDQTQSRVESSELPENLHYFPRHCQCVAWLRENAQTSQWLAIDDEPWRYTPFCPNVYLTNSKSGLTAEDIDKLRDIFKASQ